MHECLGWITNCPNEQSCPQNWLELAVSEIPTDVRCHVCEQSVGLVTTENELEAGAQENRLVAFPVVPCTALEGGARVAEAQAPVRRTPPAPEPAMPRTSRAAAKAWYVTLSNGESVKVDKDNMIVGRSRTCDVVIPSAKVSRQHASLSLTGDVLYIEDLGSANGVWLSGEKVTRSKVSIGDAYTISDETLTFARR